MSKPSTHLAEPRGAWSVCVSVPIDRKNSDAVACSESVGTRANAIRHAASMRSVVLVLVAMTRLAIAWLSSCTQRLFSRVSACAGNDGNIAATDRSRCIATIKYGHHRNR